MAVAVARDRLGRPFANLLTQNVASSLGDGIARTAAPLLAIQLTTDPLLVSGIAALALLPWLLFAIPAGVLVDRIDRRRALALANTVRTLLAVAMLVLVANSGLTIWWLYAIVFLYGMAETVYDGAVRAVVPSLVTRPNLSRANGWIEVGEQVAQNFAAAPLTSLLFAVSVLIPLGVNSLMFAVAVGLALALPRAAGGRTSEVADAPRESVLRQLTSGFAFIRGNRMLLTLWLFSTFIGFCFAAATSNFALYAIDGLGLPEKWFGVFALTGAVGAVIGGLLAGRIAAAWGTGLTMAVCDLVSNVVIAVPGIVQNLWVLGAAFVLTSATVTIWNVLVISLRQSIIPTRLLGRVHGTWRTLLWGCMPLGAIVGGLLGRIDLGVPFWAAGAASTVASILFFRFLTRLPEPADVVPDDVLPSGDAATPVRGA